MPTISPRAMRALAVATCVLPAFVLPASVQAQTAGPTAMTFFITSANPGRGGDLGGLAGADAHCAALARAAGAPAARTWRAYLSTQATPQAAAVNARDRIGRGPWQNLAGTMVARDVENLHSDSLINAATGLTEKGERVPGRGDSPNNHDILTGSRPDGTAFVAGEDRSCRNWTSGSDGSAMVGHHDRTGLDDSAAAKSWNSSHPSRGCGLDALRATGGAGLFYCFAID